MAITTRTVRAALLAAAALLVAVIVGFVGYAHFRAQRLLLQLPGRIGAGIKQETNGFTYSQSLAGRTVFTVHAAREIQRNDGRITLHDVGITVYGKTLDEADQIRGTEFEYDSGHGILTAAGEVFLDLRLPAGSLPASAAARGQDRMLHVKTSGLIFNEKQRTASTEQPLEFSAGVYQGSAVGASYDSAGGLVTLGHSIRMQFEHAGRPVSLTAAHADFDRSADVVRLQSTAIQQTILRGMQRLSAGQARLQLSAGSPPTLHADGDVVFERADQGTVTGDRLDVSFAENATRGTVMRRAQLSGNVRLARETGDVAQQGHSSDLEVSFAPDGQADGAHLGGGVTWTSRTKTGTRTLSALRVNLALAASGRSRTLGTADAFGEAAAPARLELTDISGGGKSNSTVSAVHLRAQFAGAGKTIGLETVHGEDHTSIAQTKLDSHGNTLAEENSTADTLKAEFTRSVAGHLVLARAEQQGHVTAIRHSPARTLPGRTLPAATQHARADAAVFNVAENRLRLSGAVEVTDAAGALLADEVEFLRATGDATAEGNVRVSYLEPGSGQQPLHITAARAQSNQASGITDFFGGAGGESNQTRLWQDGSQIEAAQIRFDRQTQQVTAQGGKGLVHAVLGSGASGLRGGLVRVAAHELVYSSATRRIDLSGSVQLEQASGSLRSLQATVFLAPPPRPAASFKAPTAAVASGLTAGKIDRIVAEGALKLHQPGRTATGDRLVYSAADQTYTLTGSQAAPPRVTDREHGTITGAALRFHGGDDSVEILGEKGERVESQTYVKPHPKGF